MPELSEEDLKNMSPEEIAELQKKNCIFCHIISGKVPSNKVYEDDKCVAILDINPAAKGHLLLMPKEHFMILPQIPEQLIRHLGKVSRLLSKTLIKIGATGTNIFIANGAIAGQRAPHVIIHIIPRNENDGITCFELPERTISEQDMLNIQLAISKKFETKIEVQTTPERIAEKPEYKPPVAETKIESVKRYITSSKAKRFHVETCPFADKIPKESRIYLTEQEARRQGLAPCECTGIKKKLEEIDLNKLKEMLK